MSIFESIIELELSESLFNAATQHDFMSSIILFSLCRCRNYLRLSTDFHQVKYFFPIDCWSSSEIWIAMTWMNQSQCSGDNIESKEEAALLTHCHWLNSPI